MNKTVPKNIRSNPNCCPTYPNVTPLSEKMQDFPVGMGYVPMQVWDDIYEITEGYGNGTIFAALDLPFYGCIPAGYQRKGGSR